MMVPFTPRKPLHDFMKRVSFTLRAKDAVVPKQLTPPTLQAAYDSE
jgi:hypothetical protein